MQQDHKPVVQRQTVKLRKVGSFFRYVEQRGWCNPGIATAIMSPRLCADESLPKGPSWQDVHRLLVSTEGDLPKDIRDRTIIMLFAVYGMRVGEVRALYLEDLNWENELICLYFDTIGLEFLKQRKNRRVILGL